VRSEPEIPRLQPWGTVNEKVNDDRTPIEITSRRGDAVLLSRADYDALEETAHLLRVPANAKRLIESLQQARTGQHVFLCRRLSSSTMSRAPTWRAG
jgi:antitoxin YefM